jgi:hypothetical protein
MVSDTLTDIERRVIANLSIPRNVQNLMQELAADPGASGPDVQQVQGVLEDVESRGFVHKLGQHQDPAKLAAQLPKRVLEMPDDKAEIYVRRMSQPRHSWRLGGDLWMITNDGVEELHKPTVDAASLPPSQVQAVIDQEWARTLKDVDPDNVPEDQALGPYLLVPEFTAWAQDVAAECERVWNTRPVLPLAGGVGWTDAMETSIIDAENQKTTYTVSAPWYMALTILAFTDTDTGTTADDVSHKPGYTGYARCSVAAADMNGASSGSATNANAITFAACTAGTSAIVGFGNCSALTVGTLRKYGATGATVTVSTTQTPASFAANNYTTTAD